MGPLSNLARVAGIKFDMFFVFALSMMAPDLNHFDGGIISGVEGGGEWR